MPQGFKAVLAGIGAMNLRYWMEGASTIRAALFLLLITILIASTRLSAGEEHKWGNIPPTEWSQQPPADFPHAPAIVLFNDGDLKIGLNKITLEYHVRFKIFDRQAVSNITNVEFAVRTEDELRDFKAQTQLPDGKSFRVASSDLLRKKLSDKLEIFSFSFPGVENGCILEMKYRVEAKALSRDLPSWQFQSGYYSLESNFSLTTYPGFVLNTVLIGLDDAILDPIGENTHIDGRSSKRFTWTRKEIPPLVEEPFRGAQLNFRPSIYLQFASQPNYNIFRSDYLQDWSDLERGLSEVCDYALMFADSLNGVVDSLVPDPEAAVTDRIRSLYRFVREQVTTTAAPFNHFFPTQTVDQTFSRRVGSPADKNLLLIALLRLTNIIANPILIASRDHARFSTKILNTNQFNYMLCHAVVDDSAFVLDAADNNFPFPYLPPQFLAEGGLLLASGRLRLARLSYGLQEWSKSQVDTVRLTLPQWPSGISNNASIWISDDGSALCSTHVSLVGYEQEEVRNVGDDELTSDLVKRLFPSIRNNNIELLEANRLAGDYVDSTVFDFVFRIVDFSSISDKLVACVPALLWSGSSPFTSDARQFPIDFRYPSRYTESLDLHTNATVLTTSFPEDFSSISPDLIFSRAVLKDENSARILTTLYCKRTLFLPAEYHTVKNFYQSFCQSVNEPFTMTIQ